MVARESPGQGVHKYKDLTHLKTRPVTGSLITQWPGLSGQCCGVPAHSYFRIGPFELPPQAQAPLELETIAVPIAAI